MSRGIDWVTPEEAEFLIHFGWACVFVFTAWCGRAYGQMWKRRYEDRCVELAELRDDLSDARYERTARQQPIELPEWVDPAEVPAHRRRWHTRLGWPGLNCGQLPLEYGDNLDAGRLGDLCLAPSMTELALHQWLAEDQVQSFPLLDVEGLMIARLLTEIEALDTREMEALDA